MPLSAAFPCAENCLGERGGGGGGVVADGGVAVVADGPPDRGAPGPSVADKFTLLQFDRPGHHRPREEEEEEEEEGDGGGRHHLPPAALFPWGRAKRRSAPPRGVGQLLPLGLDPGRLRRMKRSQEGEEDKKKKQMQYSRSLD